MCHLLRAMQELHQSLLTDRGSSSVLIKSDAKALLGKINTLTLGLQNDKVPQ